MKKRIVALTAAAISLSSLVLGACENGIGGTNDQDVKIWTAPSYVKILQDIDYSKDDEYQNYYEQEVLEVSMFRNEKEGGQIILSPALDVKKYDITISELTSASGAIIPKEAVTVYNEKYVDVKVASPSATVATVGMNPDAFLPFETALEYGETKIKGEDNQGIYVEFDSKDFEEGVYTGNYQLTIDGKQYQVPVKLTVWAAEIPDANNLRTSFLLRTAELQQTELDGSKEMFYKYYDEFLNYRINCTNFSYSTVEEYAELLRKYYPDERVTTINFLKFENSAWTDYDYDLLASNFDYITALCIEDGVNYYDKMYYYVSQLDEPHLTKTEARVAPTYKNIARTSHEHIREIQENRDDYDVSDELIDNIINSIENFEWVLTSQYRDDFLYENNKSNPENPDEEYTIAWCPLFTAFNTPGDRENQQNEGMNDWWYGCDWPGDPYPTYHLDDKILTARLCSWMQYNYGVEGNLYWRVNYTSDKSDLGLKEPVEDQYDITNENKVTNGDGHLVYPGKPYGLDTFVPSFRLIAVRDGMEDYEALKVTGDMCQQIADEAGYMNYDPNSSFASLYTSLYQGAKIIGDDKDFALSREMLAQLSTFAAKGTIVANIENKLASKLVTVYAKEGTIKVNGVEPTYTVREDGKEYVIEVVQDKIENNLVLTLEHEGTTSEFSMFVGGKKAAIDSKAIKYSALEKNSNTIASEKVDDGVVVTVGTAPEGVGYQVVRMGGDAVQSVLKSGVTSIQIEVENLNEDAFRLEIGYIGEKSAVVYKMATTYDIQKGTTLITINVGTLDWKALRSIKELRFYMYFDEMQERNIKVKSISVAY